MESGTAVTRFCTRGQARVQQEREENRGLGELAEETRENLRDRSCASGLNGGVCNLWTEANRKRARNEHKVNWCCPLSGCALPQSVPTV